MFVLCFLILNLLLVQSNSNIIKIRGLGGCQYLPYSQALSWPTWTYQDSLLTPVESEYDNHDGSDADWVNPTTFDDIYFPKDLPLPKCRPSISILVANNTPRYLMPGVVMTLETPDKLWRNRGMKTLPRSNTWIDLFTSFPAGIKYLTKMNIAIYGKMNNDVRFLEDIDGSTAWQEILIIDGKTLYETYNSFLTEFNQQQKQSYDIFRSIREGYHYIDIPFPNIEKIQIPRYRMKMFLSDFDTPRNLIETENGDNEDPMSMLDSEACGEIDINCKIVGAGGQSKFLPMVYRDLFESGNIVGDPRRRS